MNKIGKILMFENVYNKNLGKRNRKKESRFLGGC